MWVGGYYPYMKLVKRHGHNYRKLLCTSQQYVITIQICGSVSHHATQRNTPVSRSGTWWIMCRHYELRVSLNRWYMCTNPIIMMIKWDHASGREHKWIALRDVCKFGSRKVYISKCIYFNNFYCFTDFMRVNNERLIINKLSHNYIHSVDMLTPMNLIIIYLAIFY